MIGDQLQKHLPFVEKLIYLYAGMTTECVILITPHIGRYMEASTYNSYGIPMKVFRVTMYLDHLWMTCSLPLRVFVVYVP